MRLVTAAYMVTRTAAVYNAKFRTDNNDDNDNDNNNNNNKKEFV